MAAISTTNLVLPKDVAKEIVTKAKNYSTIQTLSAATPMLFKDITHMLFTTEPEAEFVAEGGQKNDATALITPVPGEIHKAQVTVRLSDEVKWADEDGQLTIIEAIEDASARAVGRALDYGVYHAINPRTGGVVSTMTALTTGVTAAGNDVTKTADALEDLDDLTAKVLDYEINGLALSRVWANELRKQRNDLGQRLFPEIPLSLNAGNVDGIPAATSNTVNGQLATTATGVLAILGNFDLIKWGIVRDLGLEIIETGDPDGLGDLKRYNQIAYRTEIVYNWAVLDAAGFAVLRTA